MASFRFLGFAAFEIVSEGKHIVIDPFLNGNAAAPLKPTEFKQVDLLLVSHAAFDHLGDAAEVALHYNCPVITGGDCKLILIDKGVPASQIIETTIGLTVQAAGIRVRPVQSLHRSAAKLQDGMLVTAPPLGFIIYLPDGTRVYNASDTALFSDLKLIGDLHKPHVGLINVTIENPFDFLAEYLTGEMTAYEASLAAQWLGLDVAIACHYTIKDCPDVNEFISLLNQAHTMDRTLVKPVALEPGETYTYQCTER